MEKLKNQKIAIGYFKLKTIIIKLDHLFDEYTRPRQFIEKTENEYTRPWQFSDFPLKSVAIQGNSRKRVYSSAAI